MWQCDGPCKDRPPYFGIVKRSMNRAPGKSDSWWARHEAECGGTYTKTHEPPPTKKKIDAMSRRERAGRQKNKLDGWLKPKEKQETDGKTSHESRHSDADGNASSGPSFGKRKAANIS